jgi:hypothetical protein
MDFGPLIEPPPRRFAPPLLARRGYRSDSLATFSLARPRMRGKENPMRLAVVPILLLVSPLIAVAQSNTKCSGMAQFRSPGMTLEITRAAVVPEGRAPGGRGGAVGSMLPAHCRVDGMIDRRMGSDGKMYGIRFAIALPDNWSGQFLQQGGGGLNGSVAEPTGAQAAGDQPQTQPLVLEIPCRGPVSIRSLGTGESSSSITA